VEQLNCEQPQEQGRGGRLSPRKKVFDSCLLNSSLLFFRLSLKSRKLTAIFSGFDFGCCGTVPHPAKKRTDMKFADVAENVKLLVENPPAQDEFIFELLLAYGTPKATIARLKSGQANLAKEPGEVLLKKKVFFKALITETHPAVPAPLRRRGIDTETIPSTGGVAEGRGGSDVEIPSVGGVAAGRGGSDLFAAIEEMKTAKAVKTNDPRFLIVVDDCRAGTVKDLPAEKGQNVNCRAGTVADLPAERLEGFASSTVPALQKQPFSRLLAFDRKTNDSLDIKFEELEFNFAFFLPLAGMEKTKLSNENPADVKAAEKMAKLFDAIKQDNPDYMRHDAHAMNVFLARLLFCLFAEDTGIFPENAVSNAIASHTAEDGSDLDAFFKELFDWLDTPGGERDLTTEDTENTEAQQGQGVAESIVGPASCIQEPVSSDCGDTPSRIREGRPTNKTQKNNQIQVFLNLPYVNGGLFRDHYDIPVFSAKSRRMLIEAGSLTWAEINPDIFGSMFQAVIDPEERHNLGQHYTSVTNIMKVIEPLFLNDFKEELERARNLSQKNVRTKALHDLHDRIAKVKIFDPACGSGNFLIIAYKELRKLEMELFEAMNAFPVSRITVDQFYGIEIDDFACETATLSLWLAEHQMNLEYQKRFKQSLTSLPLKDGAHIVCDNACRIDWETVCPKNKDDEIYILGNPPYLGARMQNADQKSDLARVFAGIKEHKNLDYIACWFWKGAQYIQQSHAQCAFVSTNSICQGEQVALLWPHIFSKGLEISFAHESFKWANNAKNSAAVICVIVGLRNLGETPKYIFRNQICHQVENINAYLAAASNLIIEKQSKSICGAPVMKKGSQPTDGGNLILTTLEKDDLVQNFPEAQPFVKRFMGSVEFIRGDVRWCLWIPDACSHVALSIPPIMERIEKVRQIRLESTKASTRDFAKTPYRFTERRHAKAQSIIVPSVSSERREYIPIGYLDETSVISNLAFSIPDAPPWTFGIISSRMHMTWVRTVAGRLKTDYRYSAGLCYNTFPIPDLTEEQKQTITMHVGNVLEEREKHPEKTMAQLYDPDKMPAGLREAHHQLDLAVDRLYRSRPFTSDEERREHLFKLYEEMIAKEKLI
jgi:hypothetical protein